MILISIVIVIAANMKIKLLDGMMPLYVQKPVSINAKHHTTSLALVDIILLVAIYMD
jgi:hypothetical protein